MTIGHEKTMNSFILISKNPDQQEAYVKKFVTQHAVSPFDITRIAQEGSIGIEIVRKLQQNILFKPFKGKEKIIIIDNAQKLTIEAQNALLKLLEEPPIYLIIFLCSNTEETFLPTVLSRCQTIQLDKQPTTAVIETNMATKQSGPEEQSIETLQENLYVITNGTIREKLALAEILAADKENVPLRLENLLLFIRQKMLENIASPSNPLTPPYPNMLYSLQEAHKTVTTTNVSPRTILEHAFLRLEKER